MAPVRTPLPWREDPSRVRPMLAMALERPIEADLENPALWYEPKLDGIRALIALEPAASRPGSGAGSRAGQPLRVAIWSRLGNEKTRQFPEVVQGLQEAGRRLRRPLLLDGEIVALDGSGVPVSFQRLQGRMHLNDPREIARLAELQGTAFVAFDVLRDGDEDLRPLPLVARRARLERIFADLDIPGVAGSASRKASGAAAAAGRKSAKGAKGREPVGAHGAGHRGAGDRAASDRAAGHPGLGDGRVRLGGYAAADGRALHDEAVARGWEGLIAKIADSTYESGRRTRAWRKLKLVKQQEFVIGGWTEPRETRMFFGALLLGVYERGADAGRSNAGRGSAGRSAALAARDRAAGGGAGQLQYVGHTGTGFTHQELARLFKMLQARATNVSPFSTKPASNERPHWVRPELVCQVKFSEWTDEHLLRHPVYLGLRDDLDPKLVTIEPQSAPIAWSSSTSASGHAGTSAGRRAAGEAADAEDPTASKRPSSMARKQTARSSATHSKAGAGTSKTGAGAGAGKTSGTSARGRGAGRAGGSAGGSGGRGNGRIASSVTAERALLKVVDDLQALQDARRDGTIELPDGGAIDVTNLAKVFWPDAPGGPLTKGDLLRYYVRASPWLLPVVEDRPLVMKRFPNGVKGKAFYQQRAYQEQLSADTVPAGVRVEMVEEEGEADGVMPRIVGGSLVTLLYLTQLAAISQDPWFSRVQSPEFADYVALDLDPMDGVGFDQVLDVARYVHEELEALHIPACPKTSGASGLHIYIPLPPETTYETGQLLCHIVATMVATKHRRIATIERQVAKRGKTVYVDYLQNIQGKTLATAYSARASEFAGVSTPLTWEEVHDGVSPEDFTLRTVLPRFEQVGDLWAPVVREARPVDLRSTLERLAASA